MGRKRMILLMTLMVLMIMMSAGTVFAAYKEPDMTDVTGIRFEPAAPIVFEEWVDGILYCDEDDEIHRFDYDYRSRILQGGNALILIKKDGSESKYIYNTARGGFVGDGNYKIKRAKVHCYSPDMNYDAVWHVWNRDFSAWATGDHTVNIEYKGLTCETTVAVVENNIDSVEYLQHDPLVENYDGDWRTDAEGNKFFDYHYFYEDNDIIRITRKDGTVKEYKHKEDDWDVDGEEWDYLWFESKDGQRIYLRSYQLDDNQYNHHWTLGSDNYAILYYGGKEYQFQVTIVGSPIDSISYKPAVPITYRENVYLEQRWDAKTQSSYYAYSDPEKWDGDKLTVVKNGKKKVYTYSSNKYAYINGKDRIDAWDIDIDTYQKEKPWVLGSDNEVEFNYLGRTCRVKVTVQKDKVKNPVKVSGKTVKVKYTKVRKKTQKIWDSEAFSVVDNEGKVTYKLTKKDKKAKNKITVSKDGTVTVKKGLKKGKYTIKVSVKAAGNEAYAPISKTVTVKVNVK